MCKLNSLETGAALEAQGFKCFPLGISQNLSVLLDLGELCSPKGPAYQLPFAFLRTELNNGVRSATLEVRKSWVVFSL